MITIVAANIADALAPGNPLLAEGAAEGDVEALTWRFAERGAKISAPQYLRAQRTLREVGERLSAFLQRYDVLLTTTMAQPPMRLGPPDTMTTDFDGFNRAVQPSVCFPPKN